MLGGHGTLVEIEFLDARVYKTHLLNLENTMIQ